MSLRKIAIITDSTCDIPDELRATYDLTTVPLYIHWGKDFFRDGVDLSAIAFYQRLVQDPEIPKTSQPSPQDFLEVLHKLRQQGVEEALIITLSSAMSGTYESAQRAAAQAGFPVTVHDSRTNSMSLGWQVLAAARCRAEGGTLEAMCQAADTVRRNLVYIIALDTMTYLHKGGRIGTATAFLGSLLHIKPLIKVNHESGAVEAADRSRTREGAIRTLYQNFFKEIDTRKPLRIAVLHNDALQEAEALVARVQEEFSPREMILHIVSPILGVHTGPRALALCGYGEG